MEKTINDLEVGMLVRYEDEYAVVTVCPHGKKYYALVGWAEDVTRWRGIDNPVLSSSPVSDWDIDYIPCCG